MSCRLCGAPTTHRRALTERMFGTGERFDYEDCTGCGSTQIAQIPADLPRHYPTGYYSFSDGGRGWLHTMDVELLAPAWLDTQLGIRPPDDPAALAQSATLIDRVVALYLPGLAADPQRSVLDVGCGGGSFVRTLLHRGFSRVEGIEPHLDRPVEAVRRVPLESIEQRYDHLLFQHSLEHMEDPFAALVWARSRLRPGGEVLVRVPVVDNGLVEEHADAWSGYDPPRHLVLFSERALVDLARRAGLKVVHSAREQNLWSVLATEQWTRGVPMKDPRSALVHPTAPDRDPFDVLEARSASHRANRLGRGDQSRLRLVAADETV